MCIRDSTNPAKHKEFTGRSNELMMENARKVALSGKTRLVIRVPVIPTFNDTVEEIQGIARFAAASCSRPASLQFIYSKTGLPVV